MLAVTAAGFGTTSPVIGIGALIFAIVINLLLGIADVYTMTFIILASVIGIAIGVKIRR